MVLFQASWPIADSAAPLVPDGAAAFDSSGELLAVEDIGNRIRIVDFRADMVRPSFTAAVPSISALAFSGDQVAVGSPDGRVVVQSAWGGRVIREMATGTGSLRALAFSPDGRLLAAGDADGNAIVFNASSGKELRRAKTEGPVSAIAVPDSGAPLLLGGPDEYIGIHPSVMPPRGLPRLGSAVTALAFPQRSSGEPLVGRGDGSTWRIDPLCRGQKRWINDGDAPVRALWAGPRGQAKVLGGDGDLHAWLSAPAVSVGTGSLFLGIALVAGWLGLTPSTGSAPSVYQLFHKLN